MDEIKTLRMNIMGGMNAYVIETIKDENILYFWWTHGLPKEVTEEMLIKCAEDDYIWLDVVRAFSDVLRTADVLKMD